MMTELPIQNTGKLARTVPVIVPRPAVSQQNRFERETPSLSVEYLRILTRWRRWLLGAALLGAVVGFAITVPTSPLYQTRTSLEVKGLNEDFLNMRSVTATSMAAAGDSSVSTLQTDIKLLQSKSMLDRTARRVMAQMPSMVVPASDLISETKRSLGFSDNAPQFKELVWETAKRTRVKPLGMTSLLEITCQSPSPVVAAAFCNSLTSEFIKSDLEERSESARKTSEYLTGQLREIRQNLERSEEQLQSYAQQTTLLSSGDQEGIAQERLRQLQRELSNAQVDRIVKQAQYQLISSPSEQTLPSALDNGPVRDYETQLSKLRQEYADTAALFTPEYSKVKRLRAQIADLEKTLAKERGNIAERIKSDFSASQQREALLKSAYEGQAARVASLAPKETQYNMTMRDVEAGRQLYATLLQRAKEAGLVSAMHSTPVRVVDAAEQPQFPVAPRRVWSSGMGLLLGAFSGTLLAFFKDRTSRKLQQPGEAMSQLQVRELGVIPAATVDRATYSGSRRLTAVANSLLPGSPQLLGEGEANAGLELVTWVNKSSLMAESYRSVMSSLLFFDMAQRRKIKLLVSSPSKGEGKTTLISNLGIALAQTNRSVVIVDGDMRRPRIHNIFKVDLTPGLSNVLDGDIDPSACALDAIAKPTAIPNVFVLPSGAEPDDPASALFSPNLAALITRLEQEFDVVLIDSPPMLYLSDARALARSADGVILVLRLGKTNYDEAARAQQIFRTDGAEIYGVVLNDFDPSSELSGSYYGSYHRYQKEA